MSRTNNALRYALLKAGHEPKPLRLRKFSMGEQGQLINTVRNRGSMISPVYKTMIKGGRIV